MACKTLEDYAILVAKIKAEVAAMSLLEGCWEEYADSMDQELERLKKSEKKLKEEVLEKDARIKELEALLASRQ